MPTDLAALGFYPQTGEEKKMSKAKYNRAWTIAATAGVHTGTATKSHIWDNITKSVSADVLWSMTSKQIGAMIVAANASYQDAKARAGASIEDDCVWVGGDINKLIPMHVLTRMERVTAWADVPNPEFGKTVKSTLPIPYPLERGGVDTRKSLRDLVTYWRVSGDTGEVTIKD